jgi:hypothetical protein
MEREYGKLQIQIQWDCAFFSHRSKIRERPIVSRLHSYPLFSILCCAAEFTVGPANDFRSIPSQTRGMQ